MPSAFARSRIKTWQLIASCFCFFYVYSAFAQEPTPRIGAMPRFEDYPAKRISTKRHARIVWPPNLDANDVQDAKFIDSVKEAVAHWPNFAGHFSIAHWGLGTDVRSIAIVDLATGKVFREMPFDLLDVPWDPDGKVPYRGFLSRRDSALLIASGCLYSEIQNLRECGWKYYKWDLDHFVLLTSKPGPTFPRRNLKGKAAQ